MQMKEDLVSLNELAKYLGVNKSTLSYYSSLRLIKPVSTVGRMQIFDERKTLKRWEEIKEKQKQGLTLKEIKKLDN